MPTLAPAGRSALVAALLVSLSGCASLSKWMPGKSGEEAKPPGVLAQTPVEPEPAPPRAAEPSRPPEPPAVQPSPPKTEQPEPTRRRPINQPPPKVVSLNFEGAELEQVLRVLAELAGINFVLGQGVKAQVTMRIDRLPSTEAFSIMQALLEANNLALIKAGPIYKIVPAPAAQQQPASIGIGKEPVPGLEEGYLTQIVPLQFLSAEELVKVLQPIMAPGRVLAYREANSVILSGPASMVRRVLETIQTLDVQSQQKEAQQVFVYYVENAKAAELANVLTNLFGLAARPGAPPGAPPTRPPTTRPGAQPTTPPPTPARPGAPVPPQPPTPPTTAEEARIAAEVRIVADERTNALIVRATQQDYKLIEETIRKLDIIPKQVLIEVLAAEITLTDSFSFGLDQVLRAGDFILSQSTGLLAPADFSTFANIATETVRGVAGNFQGFNLTFVDGRKFRAFLNTLAAYTKINSLATPHILTADNKEAKIQVGQEVPIVTGTQSTITAVATEGQNVFQSLQQRDVGRILTIKPHVNEKRQVTLDLQLEVSDILSLTTGNIGSPTFSKRTAQTSIVVEDNQSLLIGGIISTQKRNEWAGIPWLSRIPVLGYLFRNTTESVEKTELFIMLTPRVVASPEEGRILTEQFRQRLDWVEEGMKQMTPGGGRRGGTERGVPATTGKTSYAPREP